jgi:hypothetical protein
MFKVPRKLNQIGTVCSFHILGGAVNFHIQKLGFASNAVRVIIRP